MTPTVLVADDHAALRRGVRIALEVGGFEVVAEAGNADEAVRECARRRPDIALLDIRMPGGGIQAAASISAQVPKTKIVMLTALDEDAYLFASLRAGAVGYLLKGTDPDVLAQTLKAVCAGEAALPGSLVARLINEFRTRDKLIDPRLRALESDARTTLTAREWEVLLALGEGRTTAEIAELLGIAPVTVRTYVSTMLAKLRVPDREAAVRRLRQAAE